MQQWRWLNWRKARTYLSISGMCLRNHCICLATARQHTFHGLIHFYSEKLLPKVEREPVKLVCSKAGNLLAPYSAIVDTPKHLNMYLTSVFHEHSTTFSTSYWFCIYNLLEKYIKFFKWPPLHVITSYRSV